MFAAGSGAAAFVATRTPTTALAPWAAAAGHADPRLNALSYAILAQNPHNLQPWTAELRDVGEIIVHRDPERGLPETDPFDQVYFELFTEVGIIAQLSRALFESAQTDGLTVPHFSVLNHLVRLGDGRTPLAIARAFQTPKASMTNTLAGLEARGLIETRPNPEDGRGKLVFLTGAGRARREEAIASAAPDLVAVLADHDLETARALVPMLAALRGVLDRNRR